MKLSRSFHKLILGSSICMAVLLHGFLLFFLWDLPIPSSPAPRSKSAFTKAFERPTIEEKKAQERALAIGYQQQNKRFSLSKPEIPQFCELKAEFASSPRLVLPLPEVEAPEIGPLDSDLVTYDDPSTADAPWPHEWFVAFPEPNLDHEQLLSEALRGLEGDVLAHAPGEHGPLMGLEQEPIQDSDLQIGNFNQSGWIHGEGGSSVPRPPALSRGEEMGYAEAQAPPKAWRLIEGQTALPIETAACSDHFHVDLECSPKRSRPGYVFRVSLLPKQGTFLQRIPQNVLFLLDRSNSISHARYYHNRRAVLMALAHLKPEDTFNILVFDDHVIRFSQESLSISEESVQKAKTFLEKLGHGGIFSATDLYTSLGKILPGEQESKALQTAILLSDGDTYLTLEKQRKTIGDWTRQNKGRVSLFCVASGEGNNLSLLELLADFNKGQVLYCPAHDQVEEELVQLMRTLESPIGKELTATAITSDPKMQVIIEPKSYRLPDLYEGKPFVLYGSTNRLSDFTLFLQGKGAQTPLDIKKTICLREAPSGTYALERNWTRQLAHDYLARYFDDANPLHLEKAEQLLRPHNLPVPLADKR